MRLRRASAALAIVVIAAGAWMAMPYVSSAAFVLDLAGRTDGVRRWLPVRVQAVTVRDLTIPTRHGAIEARLYEPASARASLIVFPGIHAGGLDEPRLAAFSRRLASTGARVMAVPLPDLRAFEITPRSTDMIEDATRWMADDRALAPTGRVGLAGVSFAGGLALVAAGRPSLTNRLQVVVSIGGHADLPRVLQYLCSGVPSDGRTRPPHIYGVAVVLLRTAPSLVPPSQVEPLRGFVRRWLQAASEGPVDAAKARARQEEAAARLAALPEPARGLADRLYAEDVAALGAAMLPRLGDLGDDPALSPDRSPAAVVPVFLLHGADDSIIPSSETPMTAEYLRRQGTRVEFLLTPLVSHADVAADIPAGEAWRLVSFWTRMLAAAKRD